MNITGIILFVILIVRNFEQRKDRIHLKLVTRNVFTNEKMLITGFSSISHQCLPYNLLNYIISGYIQNTVRHVCVRGARTLT